MNVFVLNSGRCGSLTFAQACQHVTNYSSGHETKVQGLGNIRIEYPKNHIESDCRLAYFLGRLDAQYGKEAFYVHLRRNQKDSIASWENRLGPRCIINAHAIGVLMFYQFTSDHIARKKFIVDYMRSIEENILLFLKDKPLQMDFDLEHAEDHFNVFWERIEAQGDKAAALAEWSIKYNASVEA